MNKPPQLGIFHQLGNLGRNYWNNIFRLPPDGLNGTSQKDSHPETDNRICTMFKCDEIHSIHLGNGKDQFSSTDAPGPTLSVASNRRGKLAVLSSVKASFCSPARNFLSNAVPQNVECKVKECIVLTFFSFFTGLSYVYVASLWLQIKFIHH